MTASVWRQLPAANRRWIVLNALLATMVINVLVNAAIAWLSVRGQEAVPLWGVPLVETSTFWNVVGTLFLLPLITCLLTTMAVRRDIRLGTLASLSQLRVVHPWLAALPAARWRRGVLIGALALALLGPPLILALVVADPPELTRGQFIACQTAFATIVGAIVTTPIALCAMADPEPLVSSARS